MRKTSMLAVVKGGGGRL